MASRCPLCSSPSPPRGALGRFRTLCCSWAWNPCNLWTSLVITNIRIQDEVTKRHFKSNSTWITCRSGDHAELSCQSGAQLRGQTNVLERNHIRGDLLVYHLLPSCPRARRRPATKNYSNHSANFYPQQNPKCKQGSCIGTKNLCLFKVTGSRKSR